MHEKLDFLGIVNAQTCLTMLGVYWEERAGAGLGRLLTLCSLKGRPLIAVGLSRFPNTCEGYNDIAVLPELLTLELAQQFGDSVLRSQFFGALTSFRAEEVVRLAIYLRYVPPQETLCAFTASAAEVFEELRDFDIHIPRALVGSSTTASKASVS